MLEFIIVDLEYGGLSEGLLQGFKGGVLLMAPLERNVLVRQVCQWSGDTSKSFDEPLVEVGES